MSNTPHDLRNAQMYLEIAENALLNAMKHIVDNHVLDNLDDTLDLIRDVDEWVAAELEEHERY